MQTPDFARPLCPDYAKAEQHRQTDAGTTPAAGPDETAGQMTRFVCCGAVQRRYDRAALVAGVALLAVGAAVVTAAGGNDLRAVVGLALAVLGSRLAAEGGLAVLGWGCR